MKPELYTGIDGFPDFVLTNRGEVCNVAFGAVITPDDDGLVRVVADEGRMLVLDPRREAVRTFGPQRCLFAPGPMRPRGGTRRTAAPWTGQTYDIGPMTQEWVDRIREDYANGLSLGDLAKKYGKDKGYLGRIVRRDIWA